MRRYILVVVAAGRQRTCRVHGEHAPGVEGHRLADHTGHCPFHADRAGRHAAYRLDPADKVVRATHTPSIGRRRTHVNPRIRGWSAQPGRRIVEA
jgi:hypothetical protein